MLHARSMGMGAQLPPWRVVYMFRSKKMAEWSAGWVSWIVLSEVTLLYWRIQACVVPRVILIFFTNFPYQHDGATKTKNVQNNANHAPETCPTLRAYGDLYVYRKYFYVWFLEQSFDFWSSKQLASKRLKNIMFIWINFWSQIITSAMHDFYLQTKQSVHRIELLRSLDQHMQCTSKLL